MCKYYDGRELREKGLERMPRCVVDYTERQGSILSEIMRFYSFSSSSTGSHKISKRAQYVVQILFSVARLNSKWHQRCPVSIRSNGAWLLYVISSGTVTQVSNGCASYKCLSIPLRASTNFFCLFIIDYFFFFDKLQVCQEHEIKIELVLFTSSIVY